MIPINVPMNIATTGLPYARHLERAQALEHKFVLHEQWFTEKAPSTVPGAVDIHTISDDGADITFLTSIGDCLVLINFEGQDMYGTSTTVSGTLRSDVENVMAALKEDFPPVKRPVRPTDEVAISFWFHAPPPQNVRHIQRDLHVPTWADIRANYPALQPTLDDMMAWKQVPEGHGKLIIWHSPPGTGKTYAIRALAREWRKWCTFHYITDPDKFLENADYMMAVIMQAQSATAQRVLVQAVQDGAATVDEAQLASQQAFLCLVLEDSGELLTADARERQGQSLSRLLNLTEGLIGQGLNLLIMLTTNEPISTIHPAVARKGRCLQELHFPCLTIEEANNWLGRRLTYKDIDITTEQLSLADLYALKE